MMNLLESILGQGNDEPVNQLASQFGLDKEKASSAVSALLPALGAGLSKNMSSPDGLSSLLGALAGGGHQKYLDNPSTLSDPATTQDGNSILGHILGSKDVSRQVAADASQQTGIDTDTLKKMLPLVASLAMAGLSRQSASSAREGDTSSAVSGITSMLGPLLGQSGGNSMLDNVGGLIGGLFGSRGNK